MHHNNEVSWPWSDPEIALNSYHSLCSTQSLLCGSRSQQTQKDFSPNKETFVYFLYFCCCIGSEVAFSRNMSNDFFYRLFKLY